MLSSTSPMSSPDRGAKTSSPTHSMVSYLLNDQPQADDLKLVGPASSVEGRKLMRAYCDPAIFRNDRVLRTLVKREHGRSSALQRFAAPSELKPGMRREVANWMLEVCEEENCQPEVFCLAINYMDRFLRVCPIRKCQLQLLGAVCLLVSWKVRSHSSISAQKLIEYTDHTVSIDDLLEWEFLLLSKLDWDLSAVIAPDYTEHILQRLIAFQPHLAWSLDTTRHNAETLIYMCYSHPGLATSHPPSLVAVSCILTALRPALEAGPPPRDTPSPSSTSSCSTQSSPCVQPSTSTGQTTAAMRVSVGGPSLGVPVSPTLEQAGGHPTTPVEATINSLQSFIAGLDSQVVLGLMERIEDLMEASLPPSPANTDEEEDDLSSTAAAGKSKSSFPRPQNKDGGNADESPVCRNPAARVGPTTIGAAPPAARSLFSTPEPPPANC